MPALLDALVVSTGLGVMARQFLMLAVLVRLWRGGGQRSSAYWLLGLSVVALLVADAAFGVTILHGPFQPGGPIDAGYSLFLVGCGAAALHPSMADVAVASRPIAARRPAGA